MANQAAIDAAKAVYDAACTAAMPAYTQAVLDAYAAYNAQIIIIRAQYDPGDMDAELAAARDTFDQAIRDALATQPNVNIQAPFGLPTYIPAHSATVAHNYQVAAIYNKFADKRRVFADEISAAKTALDAAIRKAGDAYEAAIHNAKLNLEAAVGVTSPPGVVDQPIN